MQQATMVNTLNLAVGITSSFSYGTSVYKRCKQQQLKQKRSEKTMYEITATVLLMRVIILFPIGKFISI